MRGGTQYNAHLFHCSCIGLPLLPALIDAEERSDRIDPLDQTRPRPKRDDSIILGQVELGVVSGKQQHVSVCVCVCACMRACVRVCMYTAVHPHLCALVNMLLTIAMNCMILSSRWRSSRPLKR